MFVTKKKHNEAIKRVQQDVDQLRAVVITLHGERAYFAALDTLNEPVKSFLDDDETTDTIGDLLLETEVHTGDATPLHPIETVDETAKKKLVMPSRKEYDERVLKAIQMFKENHPRSEVERVLNVSRKTARNYLKMAISKRKVKKADYEKLNK